jgi:hypothetical protein
MKWLGATGAVLALSAVGFVGTTSSPASGTVTVTAGPGSHIHCVITGAAKLAPGLANDWDPSAHTSDPGDAFGPGSTANPKGGIASKTDPDVTGNAVIKAAVASIPSTTYTANNGNPTVVSTSAKVASGVCSNTHVVDATTPSLTAEVASVSIVSTSDSSGTNEATCGGLADTSGTLFQSIVSYKSTTTTKIAPSTITSTLAAITDIGNTGVGFDLQADGSNGTVITGSFASAAGGHSESKAYIDGTTLGAILSAPSDSSKNSGSLCEAQISGKFTPAAPGASDAIAIKLKKPKSLKAITIQSSNAAVNGQGPLVAPNDTPSSIDAVG